MKERRMPGRFSTRKQAVFSALAILVVVLAGFSGCSQGQKEPSYTDPHPLRIGVSISRKGDFAQDGQATLQGYELWADLVNGRGGVSGRRVELDIVYDD